MNGAGLVTYMMSRGCDSESCPLTVSFQEAQGPQAAQDSPEGGRDPLSCTTTDDAAGYDHQRREERRSGPRPAKHY